MINLARHLRVTLGITALACVGIICIATICFLVALLTSRENIRTALNYVGLRGWAAELTPKQDMNQLEMSYIQSDHDAISGWVMDCMKVQTLSDLSAETISVLTQPFPYQRFISSANTETKLPDKHSQSTRLLFHSEHSLLVLSQTLSTQRIWSRRKVTATYQFWEITSIITIGLGMLTTILVSLSSTEFGRGERHSQRLVRIFAIVFPALGTAAAAIIAFYGPQAEWGQASRALAGMAQLHGQMAIDVWKLPCISKDDDESAKKVATALDGWSKRYVDIQTVSTATDGSANPGGGSGNTRDNSSPGSSVGSTVPQK
jgi:hypothetical protein